MWGSLQGTTIGILSRGDTGSVDYGSYCRLCFGGGIWAPKPHYLGPWTLRDSDIEHNYIMHMEP